MKLTKNRKKALSLVTPGQICFLPEAVDLVKQMTYTKFDASVDLDVSLGVDPRKSNEMVRGVVTLPHGTGRTLRVLALVPAEFEAEATEAGADYVGLDEMVDKIKGGWLEFDSVVTVPQAMGKVGQIGRILGPRGLMPNPKSGTVTQEVGKAVREIKSGKIDFRVDKYGIIHVSVGKVSFDSSQLVENAREFLRVVNQLKPTGLKGVYMKSAYLSSTMSPSVKLNLQRFNDDE